MRHFISLLLSLLLAFPSLVVAQSSILDADYSQFTPRGLSSGTSYTAVRDREGFIWISTRNGIDRYDGQQFRHYRLNGATRRGLHDGMMIYLYQDDEGGLWVFTERSIVYRYNPLTDTFEQTINFPPEDGVGSLEDMYVFGNEIIFAVSNGLMSYEFVNGRPHRVAHLLTDRDIRCIAPYTDGTLLIGTNKGLAVYDPVQHRATTIYDRLFVDAKKVCYNAADHTIWVGANGQGLYVVQDDATGRITRVGDKQFVVHRLYPYSSNEILVGTDGDGLQLVRRTDEGYQLSQFASDTDEAAYAIHSSCVRDVLIDDGKIWLAMHFGGITCLQPASSVIEFSNPVAKVPSDSYVFGTSFDQQGRLWLAFNQTIGCFEPNGELHGLYLDHQARFLTIEPDPDGTMWCGGFNTGLYHFDPVTGKHEFFPTVHGSSTLDCVYAVHFDPRGYAWVGGLDFGLTCIIPTKPRKIGDDPLSTLRFEHTSIRQVCDIAQLNDSTLAVATSDGLYLYNYYTHRQEHLFMVDDDSEWQLSNFFCSLAVRHNREIWMAVDGAGLLLYDTQTSQIQSFGLEHGLPSLELRGVTLADDSTLCVASELEGIFSFDCERRAFKHRLWSAEGSQFQQNSIATDGRGMVVAGCNRCAVLMGEEAMQPHYVDASIRIDGLPIIDGKISLPSDAPDLILNFTTNDIYHQSEYQFFYRVDGLDKDWNHFSDLRHLEYHKIPAGDYRLDVRAYGAGGRVIERSVDVEVEYSLSHLVPQIIIVILLCILVVGVHIFRSRQKK